MTAKSRALELSELAKRAAPGPWRSISDAQHPANRRITSDDRPHIAKVYGTHLGDEEDGEANAAFIAAFNPKVALELLDALLSEQRRAEEAWKEYLEERSARMAANNREFAFQARAEAAESQLQRLRGALEAHAEQETAPLREEIARLKAERDYAIKAMSRLPCPFCGDDCGGMGEEKAS